MKEYSNQTNCRTYFSNGTLTDVSRYSLREWSHNNIDQANSHDDSKTFEMFVDEVNTQDKYNKVNGPLADKIASTAEDAKPVIFGTGFDGGITDLQVGPDGYLYVLTFAGAIYRIVPVSSS